MAMIGIAVGTRLLTEVASTSTFGEAKLVLGIIGLFIALTVSPFSQFAMREYHDAVEMDKGVEFKTFARSLMWRVVCMFSATIVFFLLIYWLITSSPPLYTCIIAGLMFSGESFFSLERSFLITQNLQIDASFATILKQWCLPFAATAGIIVFGDSSSSFLAAQATILLSIIILIRWYGRNLKIVSSIDSTTHKQWIFEAKKFVYPMLGLGFFNWVVNISDRYILAYYLSAAEVGKYAAVYGLVMTPLTALGVASATLLYPLWFKKAAEGDQNGQKRMQWGMILLTSTTAVAAVTLVWLFGDLIVSLILAERYREGAKILMLWLVVGGGFLIVSFGMDMRAYAEKRTIILTISYGFAAATNIIMNLILIPNHGAVGAATSTAGSFALYLIAMILFQYGRKQ